MMFSSDLINIQVPQFDDANCLSVGDPELFFYNGKEAGAKAQINAAKKICDNCVVRLQCLDFALDNEIRYGVWGGLDDAERRKILKLRRMKEKKAS